MAIQDLNRRRYTFVIAVCIAGPYQVISLPLQASEVQVGRYSMYAASPTAAQTDLLVTTVSLQFPERIQTLGEAVGYLLQRSGYRLANVETIVPDTVGLFALPLPAVHRSLGPMTLRDALNTLAGPAFRLVQDPVHRLITFERCTDDSFVAPMTGKPVNGEVTEDEE